MWDLRNYHIYNPFQSFHNRFGFDVAPAQQQSYFNPILDYPFYFLVRIMNDRPRVIAFLMGMPQGVNLWLIGWIAWRCQPSRVIGLRLVLTALAVAVGATGSATLPLVGATTGDLFVAVPVLAALLALLWSDDPAATPRAIAARLALSGFLAGCAIGAKPTMIGFAIGLAVASTVLVPLRSLPRTLLLLMAGGMVGWAVTGGYHAFRLWNMFKNPIFPLANNVFHSPFWEDASLRDMRFLPKTWLDELIYPFRWGTTVTHGLVSELDFRDARVGSAVGLIAVTAVAALVRYLAGAREGRGMARSEVALLTFAVASYVVWLAAFGIYRYLIPIEMLSGVVLVISLGYLVRDYALPVLLALAASGLWATTVPLEWGHAPFGNRYLQVSAPPLPSDSLVLVVGTDPVGYLVPFFDPKVRWLSLDNNFLRPEQTNRLVAQERGIIADQTGPIRVLDAGAGKPEVASVLQAYGLVVDEAKCDRVSSNLGTEVYELCMVDRR